MRRLGTAALVLLVALAGCGKDEGSKAAFCARLDDVGAFERPFEAAFSTDNADASRRSLDQALSQFDHIVAAAPAIIEDDMELLADVLDQMRDRADKSGGGDRFDAFADLDIDTTKVEAASRDVSRYAKRECGVDLGRDVPGGTTPATAPPGG
jgi:hypothetical protein